MKAKFDLPEDQNEAELNQNMMANLVGYHCRRASTALDPFSHPRMAAFHLRPGDFAVLSLLRANPDVSQKRVAEGIGVSAPNLAPILDRLELRGLISRERSLSDKRVQTLSLTADGLPLCREAEKTAAALESEATAMLSGAERRQLITLLQKVYVK